MDSNRFSALRHSLPEAHFAELARGAGSPAVIRGLWESQKSRKLLLLLAFWQEIEGEPALFGPLPPHNDAWRMLEQIQQNAPDQFTMLLSHPQVGSWLSYAMRRRRGGAKSSDAPWYVDFGQLNTVALAGAALSGESFTTKVPLRDGRVMVPCLGMAHFRDCEPWDIADAGVVDGRLWFRHGDRLITAAPSGDSDGWQALRRITVGAGPALTVWLDDLDPFRDMADPIPPVRLSDAELARWIELLRDAWEILRHGHPEVAAALAIGVTSLVPLPTGEGWDTRSASTGDAFGAVLCSLPPDATTLAVSLVHEFAHIRLGGLMHLLTLVDGGDGKYLYAPWRDDPRPLGGLIQGVYAFQSIAAFWGRHRTHVSGVDRQLADFEFAYSRAQSQEGLVNARSASGLTHHGMAFLDVLAAELDSWPEDELPDEPAMLAHLIALGHRIGWRLRHRQPDPQDVAAVVAAWPSHSQPGITLGESSVLPSSVTQHWSQARLGLARRRIQSPQRYLETPSESWGATLTDADLALFSGEYSTAIKWYVVQIFESNGVDPWTGLALALSFHQQDCAWAVLQERPEVVRAVHRQIAAQTGETVSPVDVARWIDSVVAR